jgi:hypothetical protein
MENKNTDHMIMDLDRDKNIGLRVSEEMESFYSTQFTTLSEQHDVTETDRGQASGMQEEGNCQRLLSSNGFDLGLLSERTQGGSLSRAFSRDAVLAEDIRINLLEQAVDQLEHLPPLALSRVSNLVALDVTEAQTLLDDSIDSGLSIERRVADLDKDLHSPPFILVGKRIAGDTRKMKDDASPRGNNIYNKKNK